MDHPAIVLNTFTMKLSELILEVAEKLDRSVYGAWISPDNRIIPIKDLELHSDWYRKNVMEKGKGLKQDYGGFLSMGTILQHAAERGWVRVAHPKSVLFIDAYRKDLPRVANIIAPTLAQEDIQLVVINPMDEGTEAAEEFKMPQDRIAALKFLRGEE